MGVVVEACVVVSAAGGSMQGAAEAGSGPKCPTVGPTGCLTRAQGITEPVSDKNSWIWSRVSVEQQE